MTAPKDDKPESPAHALFTIDEVGAEVVRPLRHKHLRPDQPEDAVCYGTDEQETCCHFAAMDDEGRVIATGTLNQEDRVAGQPPFGLPGMRIRGLTVEDDWRGKGVGTAMVAHLLAHGREHGVAEAWGNARTENLSFFSRNGFKEVSSAFEIPTIGEHVVVALSLLPKGRKARKERKAKEKEAQEGTEGAAE